MPAARTGEVRALEGAVDQRADVVGKRLELALLGGVVGDVALGVANRARLERCVEGHLRARADDQLGRAAADVHDQRRRRHAAGHGMRPGMSGEPRRRRRESARRARTAREARRRRRRGSRRRALPRSRSRRSVRLRAAPSAPGSPPTVSQTSSIASLESCRDVSTPRPRRVTVECRSSSEISPVLDVRDQKSGRVGAHVDDCDAHRAERSGAPIGGCAL